ncbi:hypothetical protein [Pelagibius sp.]|uniref:hypothetical protein n=1 Tax=Pelagibius sp. TaxID=1931238 RepID=UPI00262433EB|nr:hypothetical protein [Pelagibius sp.]
MSGKTVMLAFALAAGLLVPSTAARAADGKVTVLHGFAVSAAPVVSRNEGGSGVVVHRGPARLVPRKAAAEQPTATINRNAVNIDRLEPVGNWFLDRSHGRLVVVHCYARQSVNVGGNRRIRCTSREF